METALDALTLESTETLSLIGLPDDALQQVIDAVGNQGPYSLGVPPFEAAKGLVCSKALLQQLHRLQPLVVAEPSRPWLPSSSLAALRAVMQGPFHGPWRVVLGRGKLTAEVLELARQGRVHSIEAMGTELARFPGAMAGRVVPDLLGAGCSLRKLNLSGAIPSLNGTWASTFGEEAVCSAVLRTLSLVSCGLQGPLPELRLQALQKLDLSDNKQLTGSLEPLRGCTALKDLSLGDNQHTGSLEPLRGCTALLTIFMPRNQLTGGLEPLRGCTLLKYLALADNKLTGSLEPLRCCTALRDVHLGDNGLTGSLEPLKGCKALYNLRLANNRLTGGLEALKGCSLLEMLYLDRNQLSPSREDRSHFKTQCQELSLRGEFW